MNGEKIASKIVNYTFEEANNTIDTLAAVKSANEITAIYTALEAYFLAAYEGEYDITKNLTAAFHKKIRKRVSEEEMDGYIKVFSDAYIRFSEKGIIHKSMTAVYEEDFVGYVDTVIDMIGVCANESNKRNVLSIIHELHKIAARSGFGEDPVPLKETTAVIAIGQFALLVILHLFIWEVYEAIRPFVHEMWMIITEKIPILNELIYHGFTPPLLVLFVTSVYKPVFKRYKLNPHSGRLYLVAVFLHAIYEIHYTSKYRCSGGMDHLPILYDLVFFTILFCRSLQFVKPRIEG